MRSAKGSLKPIFISVGHRVSLDTAITIAKMTCKYRVPEPVRQVKSRYVSFGDLFMQCRLALLFNMMDLLLGYHDCNTETLMVPLLL